MNHQPFTIHQYTTLEYAQQLPEHHRDGIIACVDSAFDGRVTTDDALEHICGDQVLVATDNTRQSHDAVIGFSAVTIQHENALTEAYVDVSYPCAYFAAAAIAKQFQGRGLYRVFNQQRVAFAQQHAAQSISTRTQNPRVEQDISHTLDQLQERQRIQSYTLARHALRGFYGTMLTAKKPVATTVSYDDIDYANGDAYLLHWDIVQS